MSHALHTRDIKEGEGHEGSSAPRPFRARTGAMLIAAVGMIAAGGYLVYFYRGLLGGVL